VMTSLLTQIRTASFTDLAVLNPSASQRLQFFLGGLTLFVFESTSLRPTPFATNAQSIRMPSGSSASELWELRGLSRLWELWLWCHTAVKKMSVSSCISSSSSAPSVKRNLHWLPQSVSSQQDSCS